MTGATHGVMTRPETRPVPGPTSKMATNSSDEASAPAIKPASPPVTDPHVGYLLHLADNALVLGQRNAEWCGHGPVLEEDIAMANISVDLIGQARMLYQHAAVLKSDGATEDTLAYFRDAPDFRNFTLLELPHSVPNSPSEGDPKGDDEGSLDSDIGRDYAVTIVRNFFYSALMVLRWEALRQSTDAQLAAIAERAVKETRYHLRHSRDWLVRLGDGTPESHAKTQAAWNHLLPFSCEFWTDFAIENELVTHGIGVKTASLQDEWHRQVTVAAQEATLTPALGISAPTNALIRAPIRSPVRAPFQMSDFPAAPPSESPQGKHGNHSAYLAPLLAEMQSLARQHPGVTW